MESKVAEHICVNAICDSLKKGFWCIGYDWQSWKSVLKEADETCTSFKKEASPRIISKDVTALAINEPLQNGNKVYCI